MKSNIKIRILVIFIFCVNVVSAQKKIELSQAIDSALNNNLLLKTESIDLSIAANNSKGAKLSRLPRVNFGNTIYSNYGRSLDPTTYNYVDQQVTTSTSDLFLSLPLFQGFKKNEEIEQSDLNYRSQAEHKKQQKKDILFHVLEAYFKILSFEEQAKIARLHIEFDNKQIKKEKKLTELGKSLAVNVVASNAQLAKDSLSFLKLNNRLHRAMLDLGQLMNVSDLDFKTVQPDNINQINPAQIPNPSNYEIIGNSFPLLKIALLNEKSASVAIKLARADKYPSINLIGVLATNYSSFVQYDDATQSYIPRNFLYQSRFNFYQYFGLNISVPVFNGFQTNIRLKNAKLNLQKAKVETAITALNYSKDIDQAEMEIKDAEAEYQSSKIALEAYRAQFNAIEFKYETGSTNIIDFNKSLSDLNEAQLEMAQSGYNLLYKKYLLKFFIEFAV